MQSLAEINLPSRVTLQAQKNGHTQQLFHREKIPQ
jgi:hypothetical protein